VVQRYVAMSRDIEQWLVRHVGAPAHQVRQLYSGVDSDRFRPDGPVPSEYPLSAVRYPLVLGTVGRLDPIKNHSSLLQAFARILDRRPDLRPHLRLIIVGDGPERKRLTTLVDELRLGDHVWLPGARQDTPELMRAMDVFVLPSINEGISNTILEAMASGLPVVAGRVGGNPELVVQGVTGALYDAAQPDGLETAIEVYLDNPHLRQSHGAAGRARVMQDFSLDAMVNRYLALYDELLPTNR
jgi:sugar transferase (PEP-CTERM/EpsH1 system associated)